MPVGTVIGTDPEAGQKAPRGSAVTVHVSKGPDLVVVPKFVGKTVTESSDIATQAGVQIQAQGVLGRGHRVRAQDPPEGGKVKRDSVITIFF